MIGTQIHNYKIIQEISSDGMATVNEVIGQIGFQNRIENTERFQIIKL